jgi:hypothetical protein
MQFTSTGRSRISSVKLCALFDPADGGIRYTHRVITMEGADETPNKVIEATARELASEAGVEVGRLKALHAEPDITGPATSYIVDMRKKCLVAVERSADLDSPKSPPR